MATAGPPSTSTDLQLSVNRYFYLLGCGVVFHAIVTIARRFFKENSYLPLTSSVFFLAMIYNREVLELKVSLGLLCLAYVVVSIAVSRWGGSVTKSLPPYMIDMVEEAKKGAYTSKIGYETAIRKIEILMNRKQKSNAILLGEPGIGKSTIPETIAYKIAKGLYGPKSFFAKVRLIQIDVNSLVAGTKFAGDIEKRVQEMIALSKSDPRIVYFIDEIDMLIGAGTHQHSNVDVASRLLVAMARNEIRILGATTWTEYYRRIIKNVGFKRRLPKIPVDEPSQPKCFEMLRHSYQQNDENPIKVSDQAIAAAILFSERILDRYYPDKAIDLIDSTISKIELEGSENEDDERSSESSIIIGVREIAITGLSMINRDDPVLIDDAMQYYKNFVTHNPNYFPGLSSWDSLWVETT